MSPPEYRSTLAYRRPPVSGNSINGLGETEWRRAAHVFHNEGGETLPWDALDRTFAYLNPWKVVLYIFRNIWNLRHASGPVSPHRQAVVDRAAMTREVRERARRLGADLVGVSRLKAEHCFAGREVPYAYVICVGVAMDRERMRGVPDEPSAVEVMRAYARTGRVVASLASWIREMGWPARGYGNPNSGDLLMIPAAIDCGLGQLGKHGSLISRQYGSNFRLGAVVTDLPLEPAAGPVDIGVEDLCSRCNICVRECPVDAIYNEKQQVRGSRKWYVDFDKCVYYFCETAGCGICIEVCPWNDRGPWLSQRLLETRRKRGH